MRCKDVRDRIDELWTGEVPAETRAHLEKCSACQEYARDVGLVRAGFHALAEEPVPEASLGFAARLVRQLGEAAEQGTREEFLVHVGRRFVYVASLLTLGLLLALVLPSSGPVRGPASADLFLAQPETVSVQSDSIVGGGWQENQDLLPVDLNGQNGKGRQ